jgi:hypothetical protein
MSSGGKVIQKQILSIGRARELLLAFRTMSSFFPFVVVPEKATVQSLARDSPFLLLAILTVASGMNMYMQYQLDHELRHVLSMELVVEGKRSLDFIQGLLVYVAW